MEKYSEYLNKYFEYLDRIHKSGMVNMLEAAPFLEAAFGLTRRQAGKILQAWMETFDERHPEGRHKRVYAPEQPSQRSTGGPRGGGGAIG